jgi:hypothetical protein
LKHFAYSPCAGDGEQLFAIDVVYGVYSTVVTDLAFEVWFSHGRRLSGVVGVRLVGRVSWWDASAG